YYYIDITFDDHIEKNKDYIQYDYFCITSAEMNRNHTPAKGYTYPVADSNDMNFYLHNGYVVDRYTSELSYGIVESQSRNGYIYIKFTNREAYLEAKNNSSELFSDVRRVTGKKTVTYYTGDEFYTIAFKT
ncbi:MAG: hypothetical protein IKS04_01485, partial [Clostridia bacterium]|nr:hypothetical protein [Clostridia bacterium]